VDGGADSASVATRRRRRPEPGRGVGLRQECSALRIQKLRYLQRRRVSAAGGALSAKLHL